MKKLPLVLFSGGVDSTFLVDQFLREGQSVDVLVIQIEVNALKNEAETQARMKIYEYMKDHPAMIRNSDLFNISTVDSADNGIGFAQMMPWLYGAMQIVNPEKHSSVNIGYLFTDQAIISVDHLKKAWKHMWKACRPFQKVVPLKFPLLQYSKAHILQTIPTTLFALTWSCENPVVTGKTKKVYHRCNVCHACKTQDEAQMKINEARGINPVEMAKEDILKRDAFVE